MYLASFVLLGIVIELAYLVARTVCNRWARRPGSERTTWSNAAEVPLKRHHIQGSGPCTEQQVLEDNWHARPSTSQVLAATTPQSCWVFLHQQTNAVLLLLRIKCLPAVLVDWSPSFLVQSVWFSAEVPCTALGVLVKNQVLPVTGPYHRTLMLSMLFQSMSAAWQAQCAAFQSGPDTH